MGTLADLLDCQIKFYPPHFMNLEAGIGMLKEQPDMEGATSILCKTAFGLRQEVSSGALFMALSEASMARLRTGLDNFLATLT